MVRNVFLLIVDELLVMRCEMREDTVLRTTYHSTHFFMGVCQAAHTTTNTDPDSLMEFHEVGSATQKQRFVHITMEGQQHQHPLFSFFRFDSSNSVTCLVAGLTKYQMFPDIFSSSTYVMVLFGMEEWGLGCGGRRVMAGCVVVCV